MNSLLATLAGFLLAVLICEVPLRFAKIQSALSKILIIHLVVAIFTYRFILSSPVSVSSFLILWMGTFLTWFGIRSHMESSILLRLLLLLKKSPMTATELLEIYEKHHGIALRRKELIRGGLLEQNADRLQLTQKGRLILTLVFYLREPEAVQKESQV